MGAALIGGMDRLKKNYEAVAKNAGVSLKIFTGKENRIADRLGSNTACVILFTDKLSHAARRDVLSAAKARDIPVYMFHSSGVSTLRECFNGKCAVLAA
ncbi:MAG: DUF2325 domain-containing protein [Desulfovibrionaceae bacterium]